jgi:hypothetical protein
LGTEQFLKDLSLDSLKAHAAVFKLNVNLKAKDSKQKLVNRLMEEIFGLEPLDDVCLYLITPVVRE